MVKNDPPKTPELSCQAQQNICIGANGVRPYAYHADGLNILANLLRYAAAGMNGRPLQTGRNIVTAAQLRLRSRDGGNERNG